MSKSFVVAIKPGQEDELQKLIEYFKVKNESEIFNIGLSILKWIKTEEEKGNEIASVDKIKNLYSVLELKR